MEIRESLHSSCRVQAGSVLIRRRHIRAVLALPIAIVAALALGLDAPCRAGLVIQAPNITVAPGTSGSFDVLVASTSGSFDVSTDTVELALTGLSGVSFTGVSIATTAPYIYGADSATFQNSTFTFTTFPGTQFEVFDYLNALGAQKVTPQNSPFGLVNVQYSVAADATPGATGTLAFGSDTLLTDANGNTVLAATPNGSITIFAVPEPSAVILLAIGFSTVALCAARKRSASSER
jgi:hypothetical protein